MNRLSTKNEENCVENKLELYLHDVYEKECVFKVGREEVDFIQTGIETLVQSIVDAAIKYFLEHTTPNSLHKAIQECRHEISTSVIKVGSFYEGTKNNFPDEFDFIFILYSAENILHFDSNNGLCIPEYSEKLQEPLTQAILELLPVTERTKDSLHYTDVEKSAKLYFDTYVYAKGPSAKLRFIYENHSSHKKEISVDLVPAVRQSGNLFERVVNGLCPLKEFRSQVLQTGSYLYINSFFANYTFTETEVHFMKHVLSNKHVKVYRIVKYLINGHGDDELVKDNLHGVSKGGEAGKLYSSYRIKVIMIYHHYQCSSNDQTSIGPCVLKILDDISTISDIDRFPQLVDKIDSFTNLRVDVHGPNVKGQFFTMKSGTVPMLLLPYLKSTIAYLKLMSTLETDYDYELDKVKKSVTGLYLEDMPNENKQL